MTEEEEDNLESSLDKPMSISFINANKDLFKDNKNNQESSLDGPLSMSFMGIGKDGQKLESSLDAPLAMSFINANQDLLAEQETNFAQSSADMSLSFSSDGRVLLQPGEMFYHYSIEKKIGSGGMGEVFLALDVRSNRKVAIKTLKVKSGSASERFRREYQFLSRVDHPNLIKAYDFKESDKELFLVMEFVQGKSLKELIEKGHNHNFPDKVAIACQIAQGIQALNSVGIIHRDIKPENIMVNEKTGIVKILDLGLSKDTENEGDLTLDKQVLGTCFYMAPEQIDGKVTETTDVFALGTVLWQWFSGNKESPFYADNQYRVFMRIMTHEPLLLLQVMPRDSYARWYHMLSEIITMAMIKDPSKRLANVGIIVDKLSFLHQKITSQNAQKKWAKAKISENTQKSIEKAGAFFKDNDVSLPGQVKLSGIIDKPTDRAQINFSEFGVYKPPRLLRTAGVVQQQHRKSSVHLHRKSAEITRKAIEKKDTIFIIVIILILGYAMFLFWQIYQQEQKRVFNEKLNIAFTKANILFKNENYSEAKRDYEHIASEFQSKKAKSKMDDVEKILNFFYKASELAEQENYSEVIKIYQNILKLNPDSLAAKIKMDDAERILNFLQKK